MILTFDAFTVWRRVSHLFEGDPGKWASGVTVDSCSMTSFVEVDCPAELLKVIEPMLKAEYIPYSRRSA